MRCDSWPLVPEGDKKTFTGRSSGLSRFGAFPFHLKQWQKCAKTFVADFTATGIAPDLHGIPF
jgi:hypothetical protein